MGIDYTKRDLESHDAVALVIRDEEGRVLCVDHRKFGFWTIPLGKAEEGQTPEQAARQEAMEELGIQITALRKIYQSTKVYSREGRRVIAFFFIFLVEEYSGEIRNAEPEKHGGIKYLSLADLSQLPNTSDATMMLMAAVKECGWA